jgi:hypothetical protein
MKAGKILAGVLAAAVALTGLAGVRGADGKGDESKKEVKKGVLTHESLKETLENLGYAPETLQSTAGSPMYLIRFERDGWTFGLYVALSPNGSMVWISAPLKDVPEDLASPEPLRQLLTASDGIGPSHFTLKGKRVCLNTPLENRDITPARLRAAIDETTGTVKATQNLWDTDTWARTDAGKAQPPEVKKVEDKKIEDKK